MGTIILNRKICIGCSICIEIMPEIFEINIDDGKAQIISIETTEIQTYSSPLINKIILRNSIKKCPVEAIKIK